MSLRDLPYLPLYVKDFDTDEKLRECSPGATGVYIRLMLRLHKCTPYGVLPLEQKYQQNFQQNLSTVENFVGGFAEKFVKNMPYSLLDIKLGLSELLENDVIQIENGILSQRRMVKDGKISIQRSIAGKSSAQKGGGLKNLVGTKLPTNNSTKSQQKRAIDIAIENEGKEGGGDSDLTGGGPGEIFPGEEDGFVKTFTDQIELSEQDLKILEKHGPEFTAAWKDWINYKYQEHDGFVYKSFITKNNAIEKLIQIANYNSKEAVKIIKTAISNKWKFFYESNSNDYQQVKNKNGSGSATDARREYLRRQVMMQKATPEEENEYYEQ